MIVHGRLHEMIQCTDVAARNLHHARTLTQLKISRPFPSPLHALLFKQNQRLTLVYRREPNLTKAIAVKPGYAKRPRLENFQCF